MTGRSFDVRETAQTKVTITVLKSVSSRHHSELDLDATRKTFASSKRSKTLEGEMITSPFHLYSVEELRNRLKLRIGTPISTDVFVYCKGEPPKPDWTKVGGFPYWTDHRKWPTDSRGRPLRFLAQFNFLDSKDLFSELPGDVLSIFASNKEHWLSEPLHFEWLPARQATVPTIDSKRLLYPTTVFYGAIHRSADYPEAREKASACDVSQPWNLPVLNGTKIAGRPHFIQGDDELDAQPEMRVANPFRPREMMISPARPSRRGFLCQLGSIQATALVPYPWANHDSPLSLEFDESGVHSEKNSIVFHDMGSIFVYRTESGEMWSEFQGY